MLDTVCEFVFVWGALLTLGSLLIAAKLFDKLFRCEIEDEERHWGLTFDKAASHWTAL